MRRAVVLALSAFPLAIALVGTACHAGPASAPAASPSSPSSPSSSASSAEGAASSPLQKVASIHGGAGPWAVLGYRMGTYALDKLALRAGSFDLDVRHESPRSPQFACVADGAQAATGASLGKVNLSLVEADEAHIQTVYRKKSTNLTITLRPTQAFRDRFKDVPREKLGAAGAEVLGLPDEALFEVVAGPGAVGASGASDKKGN